jgi:hypothetical protein
MLFRCILGACASHVQRAFYFLVQNFSPFIIFVFILFFYFWQKYCAFSAAIFEKVCDLVANSALRRATSSRCIAGGDGHSN